MLRIFLFGPVRVQWHDQPYPLAGLPKLPSLLAYLLLNRAHPLERQHVAFTLWTDDSEANARANLRRHLYDLKRALPRGIEWFMSDAETIRWNPNAPFSLDVAEFETLGRDAATLADAVVLYRGDLAENVYDDWLVSPRQEFREQVSALLQQLIERAGDGHAALTWVQQLARHEPLREETYRAWMRLLARQGDRAGLVRVYNLCVNVLERELDVEPAAATKQLYEELVRQQSQAVAVAPRALQNLPGSLTPLIGRATVSDEILALLHAPRLVTLSGTGGVGKTRLALQVAQTLLPEFADGVWFLDLALVSAAEQLVPLLAETLEIVEMTNRPLRAVVLESLSRQQALFVFDNCEHIIDAAAALAHDILTNCARVKILATSREALRVPGEHVIPIVPLPIPDEASSYDAHTAERVPSMQLLLERAQAAQPAFHITAENAAALARICRLTEGIPLALEFAAARLSVLRAQDLATRLESQMTILGESNRIAPARHQTLRATFDWSFDALKPAQQILLPRLRFTRMKVQDT